MSRSPLEAVLGHLRDLTAAQQSDGVLLRAFAAGSDQAAFRLLVKRHGPLVLSVCRRVLDHLHDAEDACQATFLLLARKASSLSQYESLAGWLHSVAYRVAKDARRTTVRRRRHEGRARAMPPANPEWEAAWREVQVIVDEEIQRLPAIYRDTFVLCCLENKDAREAAQALGVKEGTVGSRLFKARTLLQKALSRRGVSLSAILATAAAARGTASGALPRSLVSSITHAAAALAAGKGLRTAALSAKVSERVIQLVQGANKSMILAKLKTTLLLAASLGMGFASVGLAARQPGESGLSQPAVGRTLLVPEKAVALSLNQPKSELDRPKEPLQEIDGRVLRPDGQPLAGARLYWAAVAGRTQPNAEIRYRQEQLATSDPNGYFRLSVPQSERARSSAAAPPERSRIIAVAQGYGPDWVSLDAVEPGKPVTFRLVKDLPVHGRILDVEGRPVAGAKLRVQSVVSFSVGGLDTYLEDIRRGGYEGSGRGSDKSWWGPLPGQPTELATDRAGRFSLAGVGGERTVRLAFAGPAIQHWYLEVMTRAAETVRGPDRGYDAPRAQLYGANFDFIAAAARPIRGIVVDQATGKPLAGVEIRAHARSGAGSSDVTRTDTEGRCLLLGYPKSKTYRLLAQPSNGQPYFGALVDRADTPGSEALVADIPLVSGILLSGRALDAGTKTPVAGAKVYYYPLYRNAFAARIAYDQAHGASFAVTAADGSFQLVSLPGPGVIALEASAGHPYMPAFITPEELLEVCKDSRPSSDRHISTGFGRDGMGGIVQERYQALALINPSETETSLRRDLTLQRGRTLTGTVLGPDGQPLPGATLNGAPLATASFTLPHINPRRTQQLEFHHRGKGLGLYAVIRGDAADPVTVHLKPCGSVIGRIVDQDGTPIRDIPMRIQDSIGETDIRARTDSEGRFRIGGLIAGHHYALTSPVGLGILSQQGKDVSFPPFQIEPGQVKDLGEAKAK